ncbi:MAG: cytochrome C oxidase subunit IV family protein [Bacteroidetes bacterium]|nr:cytochrome C oxidase subunit IV family protein [Bacteroidota bacterium]
MEFQDNFPNYEFLAQHNNEAGVGVRKNLMKVFWLLLVVTLIELTIGWFWHDIHNSLHVSKTYLIIFFVMFTLVKAGYIVMAFMHLGDENKWMRWIVLAPYCFFIVYLIYMTAVTEGSYSKGFRNPIDPVSKTQTEIPSHHE